MEAFKMDTTFIMEQYNFNKPLTVKVIYEDDEDDQSKSVQYDRRQSVKIQSSVELISGEQTQARTSDQLKRSVESDLLCETIGYMSNIAETYYKFAQVFKKLSTADAASFKLKYLDMKYLFFKKCMTVTKLLLLPQKSNESFIRNIVIEVLNKANLNGNMYKTVRLLYADLLAWTEARLDNEKKDVRAQKRLQLNTAQPNHTVPHLNSENNSVHRKRRFSPHDIIEEISASNKMLKNNSVVNVQSGFPIPNHTNNFLINQDRTSCQREMQTPEQNMIYPLVVNTAPSNMVHYLSNSSTIHNAQKNYLSQSNCSNVVNMQRDYLAIGYQERIPTFVSQNLLENNLSHIENNGADGRDISRSSISRDSGFMSPDILISPPESTITNYKDFPPPWQNTTATHEMLMPRISRSNNVIGACHVCGTKTELLCLGCFQYFYCSKSCQTAHWPLHELSCRTSHTS